MSLTVDDFDFPPPELIAQHPAAERTGSRLLHVCGAQTAGSPDLPTLLTAGDLLVFNDTRVIKARFFGVKESAARSRSCSNASSMRRMPSARFAPARRRSKGCKLLLADAFTVTMTGRAGTDGDFFMLNWPRPAISGNWPNSTVKLPLPPYIEHPAEGADETVTRRLCPPARRRRNADRPVGRSDAGSPESHGVATAGLHFGAEPPDAEKTPTTMHSERRFRQGRHHRRHRGGWRPPSSPSAR